MNKTASLVRILFLVGIILPAQNCRAQQQPDYAKVQIKVTKVSGNIYMLEGEGGNIAASVGEMESSLSTISLRRWRTRFSPH